jgi:hypothetical protein
MRLLEKESGWNRGVNSKETPYSLITPSSLKGLLIAYLEPEARFRVCDRGHEEV